MRDPPPLTLLELRPEKLKQTKQEKREEREERERQMDIDPPVQQTFEKLMDTDPPPVTKTFGNVYLPRNGPAVWQPRPMGTPDPYDDPNDPDPRERYDDHPRRRGETRDQWVDRVLEAREALSIRSKPYPASVDDIPAEFPYQGRREDKRRRYRNSQEINHRNRINPRHSEFDREYRDMWFQNKEERQEHNRTMDEGLLKQVRGWQMRKGLPREPTPDPAEDSGDGFYNNEFERSMNDPKLVGCRECRISGSSCSLSGEGTSIPPCDRCLKKNYLCQNFFPPSKIRGAPHKVGEPYVVRDRRCINRPAPGQAPNDPNVPFTQPQPYRDYRERSSQNRRGRPPRNAGAEVDRRRRSRSPLTDRPVGMAGGVRPVDNSERGSYTVEHDDRTTFDDLYDALPPRERTRDAIGTTCERCYYQRLACDKKKPCNICLSFGIICVDLMYARPLQLQGLPPRNPSLSQKEDDFSNVESGILELNKQVTSQRFSARWSSATTSLTSTTPGQVDPLAGVLPSILERDGRVIFNPYHTSLNSSAVVSENPTGIGILKNHTSNPQQEAENTQMQVVSQEGVRSMPGPVAGPRITTQSLDVQPRRNRLVEAAMAEPFPEEVGIIQLNTAPDWQYTSTGVVRNNGFMMIDFFANAGRSDKAWKSSDFLNEYPKWNPSTLRRPISYNSQIPCDQHRWFSYIKGQESVLPYEKCGEIPSCKCHLLDHTTTVTDGHVCRTCHRSQKRVDVGIRSKFNTTNRAPLCRKCASDLVGDSDVIKTGDCVCGETMRQHHLCNEHFTEGWWELDARASKATEFLLRARQYNCLSCTLRPQDPTSGVWVCKSCHAVVRDNQLSAVYFSGIEGAPGQ